MLAAHPSAQAEFKLSTGSCGLVREPRESRQEISRTGDWRRHGIPEPTYDESARRE
jgi:hypothetical protein